MTAPTSTDSLLPLCLPEGISKSSFMRDYWQRKPLLMRAALNSNYFTLPADELAGLACEEDIESRLIVHRGGNDWHVRHGPFNEDDFARLPPSGWTLLVQDVDKYIPQVAALIDAFDFVPQWRIDDIMISYAVEGGGVGPHLDAYDVFLMQGAGRRRWRLSQTAYTTNDLIPGLEQRILPSFDTDEEFVLEPGDILYLPPGVAHWGIAEDSECMTYSLGFRSPSQQELAADWFQFLVDNSDDSRSAEAEHVDVASTAELTTNIQDAVSQLIGSLPDTRSDAFRLWLGRFYTDSKPQFQLLPRDNEVDSVWLDTYLQTGQPLFRHPYARIAWTQLSSAQVALFVQGEHRILSTELSASVKFLSESRRLSAVALRALLAATPSTTALIVDLLNVGVLEPASDD